MTQPLVILGASARAAAQSALRAGYQPWCVDLFADRDLKGVAQVRRCPAEQYPRGMLPLLRQAPPGPVLFTGAIENDPDLIEAVAGERPLLGCGPEAVRAVRRPDALREVPASRHVRPCPTRRRPPLGSYLTAWLPDALVGPGYIVKPVRSAGGVGVRRWRPGVGVRRGDCVQPFVPGRPLGAVFCAHGWDALLVGVTEQIVGDRGLGVDGFRYAGNLGPVTLKPRVTEQLRQFGVALTQRFDLRGVFGVDLIQGRGGRLWPIEVNPRYPAGAEVLERALGVAVLADRPRRGSHSGSGLWGKAIVHARADGRAPELEGIDLPPGCELADVPEPGEPLQAGRPVCTVLGPGADRADCLQRLRDGALAVYTRLDDPTAR